VYGDYTNAYVLNKGDIVEIVMNNDDPGKHPFHLHGHNFQAVYRAADNEGHYNATNDTAFPAVPMRRDTLMVRPQGNFVIRFKADNPGQCATLATRTFADTVQVSGSSTVISTGILRQVSRQR
jgi:iron transport multicopper oxidase